MSDEEIQVKQVTSDVKDLVWVQWVLEDNEKIGFSRDGFSTNRNASIYNETMSDNIFAILISNIFQVCKLYWARRKSQIVSDPFRSSTTELVYYGEELKKQLYLFQRVDIILEYALGIHRMCEMKNNTSIPVLRTMKNDRFK